MPVTPATPSITRRTPPRTSPSSPSGRFGNSVNGGCLLGLGLAARNHRGDRRSRPVGSALLGRRSVLLRFLRHLVAALFTFGHSASVSVWKGLMGRDGIPLT